MGQQETVDVDEVFRVETHGIDPIPDAERHGSAKDLFWLWFGSNLTFTYVINGALAVAFGLSFWQATAVVVIGGLSFFAISAAGLSGIRTGTATLVISRAAFGVRGNFPAGVLNWVVSIGYTIVNTVVGTLALEVFFAETGWQSGTAGRAAALLVTLALTFAVAMWGHATVQFAERWMAYVLAAGFGVLLLFVLPGTDTAAPAAAAPGLSGWSLAFVVMLAGPFSYLPMPADYTRYLPRTTSLKSLTWMGALGGFLSSVALGVAGVAAATQTDMTDAVAGAESLLPGWFQPLFLALVLGSSVTNSIITLYSSSLNLQVLGIARPARLHRRPQPRPARLRRGLRPARRGAHPRRHPRADPGLAGGQPGRRLDRGRGLRLLRHPGRADAVRRRPGPGHRGHPGDRALVRRAHGLAEHGGHAAARGLPGPHRPPLRHGGGGPGDRRTHRIRQGLRHQGTLPRRPPGPARAGRAVGLAGPAVRAARQEPRRRHRLRHHHGGRAAELPRRPRTLRTGPLRGAVALTDRRGTVPPARHRRRRPGRIRRRGTEVRRGPAAGRPAQAVHRRRGGKPRTAALLEPYTGCGAHRGETFYPAEEFAQLLAKLDARGFQCFVHATGDRGIRTVLDAVEHARTLNGPRDARHQVVHVECLDPADVPRFAELGVIACMQPRHCAPEIAGPGQDWAENVGEDRWHKAWPMRSLHEAGAVLAFSSDWNVAEMDPMVGIYTAVTRRPLSGGGPAWRPAETVDVATAVYGYTMGSAHANFLEQERGSLTVGKAADFVILSRDILTVPADEIPGTVAETVVVAGEVAHRKP